MVLGIGGFTATLCAIFYRERKKSLNPKQIDCQLSDTSEKLLTLPCQTILMCLLRE